MVAEQQTEWLINNILVNKKWRLERENNLEQNVFHQKSPYSEDQEKLRIGNNYKKPDFILYQTGARRPPIAIIEAKAGGIDLKSALDQATEYAKLLGAKLVFAMNGSYCETRFVPNNKALILNGVEVRELIREEEALKFLEEDSNEIYTIPKEVVVSREGLIKIFKNLNDNLRGEGIRAGIERFSQFANILFLKLLNENRPDSYWNLIKSQPNGSLIAYVNMVIDEIQIKYGGDVFNPIEIQNPHTLRHIIESLDPLKLSSIDTDIKGDAFEYFIEKTTSTENDLGEYFTPRNVVKTIVNLVDPKFKETIYDPFCGTGGFLTSAFHYIRENTILEGEDLKRLKHGTIFGSEITNTARIAKMNMILNGDGHSGIKKIDSLANVDYREGGEVKRFDIIMTNMPFSQKMIRDVNVNGKLKKENHISPLYYNGLAKNNGDALCVLHCLRNLKEGGRMALVVPEGFLFRKDAGKVREFLLSKAKLQSVISLPQGTFSPYTEVRTHILYFTDAHMPNIQKEYWFFEVQNLGVSLDHHKRKIPGMNDLDKIDSSDIKKADKDPKLKANMLGIGFEIVDLEKVKNNNYNLIGKIYRENIRAIGKYEIKSIGILYNKGLISIQKGKSITKDKVITGNIPVIAGGKTSPYFHNQFTHAGNIITVSASGAYSGYVWYHNYKIWASDCNVLFSNDENKLLTKYLYHTLQAQQSEIYDLQHGAAQPHVYGEDLKTIQIPLPPIEEQQKIVEELDSYQKIIDGAKQIIENWKPHFEIDNQWEIKKLDSICNVVRGGSPRPIEKYLTNDIEGINWLRIGDIKENDKYIYSTKEKIRNEGVSKSRLVKKEDLILSNSMSWGRPYIIKIEACIHDGWLALQNVSEIIFIEFLYYLLLSEYVQVQLRGQAVGSTVKNLNVNIVKNIQIPLPPLHIQEEIVKELESERAMVESQKEIIKRFEAKINKKLNSLWKSEDEEITDPIINS